MNHCNVVPDFPDTFPSFLRLLGFMYEVGKTAFYAVQHTSQTYKVHNRLAAYIVALERVAEAMKLRGWY